MDNNALDVPANLGISVNADFTYGIYKTEKGNLILAENWLKKHFLIWILATELIKEVQGKDLENLHYKHPFIDREGLVMLGDHVTDEAGTWMCTYCAWTWGRRLQCWSRSTDLEYYRQLMTRVIY